MLACIMDMNYVGALGTKVQQVELLSCLQVPLYSISFAASSIIIISSSSGTKGYMTISTLGFRDGT